MIMTEQQISYFIFQAACYITIIFLQEYNKRNEIVSKKKISTYILERFFLAAKIVFFFWATMYGPSKIFLNDQILAMICVASDFVFLYKNYFFFFILYLIFLFYYFRVIYYLVNNYHHLNLFILYWCIFINTYFLQNYAFK
jgi:hypothetical protein